MNTPKFHLTSVEFHALWQTMSVGRIPYPLNAQPGGEDIQERDEQQKRAVAELEARDLMRHGLPTQPVAGLLEILGRFELAIDAVASIGGVHCAFAASNGRSATLAVTTAEGITLSAISPSHLAQEIVDTLPDRPGGPGHAFSVRSDAIAEAARLVRNPPDDWEPNSPWGNEEFSEAAALQRCGVSREDATLFAELTERRIAGGQFGVTATQRPSGRVVRGQAVLNWFDTQKGRYLAVSENHWVSFAPADNTRIAVRVAAAFKTTVTV